MVDVCSESTRATGIRESSPGLRALENEESQTMKNALTRWAFGAAFGLIVSAAAISIATEQAWAESCSGTTIRHGSADCLTAVFSNNRQSLSLTNECTGLGLVTAEVKVINFGPEGTHYTLRPLSNSTPLGTQSGIAPGPIRTRAAARPPASATSPTATRPTA